MHKAETVARYLLHLAARSPEPCPITHMQLQKLMYYVQGWSLAYTDEPMFRGEIQAWAHGPVVKQLYPQFADFKQEPIPAGQGAESAALRQQDRALIEAVWTRYGQFSALRLRAMTHAEQPWKVARGDLPEGKESRAEIGHEALRSFFRGEMEAWCRRGGMPLDRVERSVAQARAGEATELDLTGFGRGRLGGRPRVAG
ncbi:MAG: DUF4065 domain-containing protein [Phycisphaerales bacterium]